MFNTGGMTSCPWTIQGAKCPLPFSWSLSHSSQGIVCHVILLFVFWQCRKLPLPLSRSLYEANMGFSFVEDLQLVYSICLVVTDPQWVSKQKRGLLRLWGNYFLFFFADLCNAPSFLSELVTLVYTLQPLFCFCGFSVANLFAIQTLHANGTKCTLLCKSPHLSINI